MIRARVTLIVLLAVVMTIVSRGQAAAIVVSEGPGEIEVPIVWDLDPATTESDHIVATGVTDQSLTEWTALEIEAINSYTITVRTVYGEQLLEAVRGEEGTQRYTLNNGHDPLWLSYQGPTPVQVHLYGQERKMTPDPVDGGLAHYDAAQALVPAGETYRAEMVNLQPGSGVKARFVCATWGGAGGLHVVFRAAASGSELGHANLTLVQPCSPVWGRVNCPFTVEITAVGDMVQVYDLIVR